MNNVSIQIPTGDMQKLFQQIARAQKELNKSLYASVKWGGRLFLDSMSAGTKVSAKLRPIIKRPKWDPDYARARNDSRFAPYGVKVWDRAGKRKFKPIYKTGEFGKLRFFDKTTVAWYDRSGGSGQWRKIQSGFDAANPEILVPGIKTDKRRVIGRRGLARNAWRWARRNIYRSGTGSVMGVNDVASLAWGGDKYNPSVTITNHLRYALNALRGGMSGVSSAVAKSSRSMATRINAEVAKKMGLK